MPTLHRALLSIVLAIAVAISASGWVEAAAAAADLHGPAVAMELVSAGAATHDAAASPSASTCQEGASDCAAADPDNHVSPSCCAGSCHPGMAGVDLAVAVASRGRLVHTPREVDILVTLGATGLLRPPRPAGVLVG